jgi:AraC-like DNA-binding protein
VIRKSRRSEVCDLFEGGVTNQDQLSDAMRKGFRLEEAPSLTVSALGKAPISIVEAIAREPDRCLSGSLPTQDAFLVNQMLSAFPACEVWEAGRHAATTNLEAGVTTIADLTQDPRFVMTRPFHVLSFQIPVAALTAIAEEASALPIRDLRYDVGAGYRDEVVAHLVNAVRPAMQRPEQANQLFVDYVVLALTAHVARTYAGMRPFKDSPKGGLAPWQEHRACEWLAAHLDGSRPLKEIAAQCGLSVSHFSRAFRQSTGLPPHRWLLQRRIEAAKALMDDRRQPLAQIALTTGFADQCHFTRVFSKHVGVSPGAWRRARGMAS